MILQITSEVLDRYRNSIPRKAFIEAMEHVNELVLGPEGITTYSPQIESISDFSLGYQKVIITYHDIMEEGLATLDFVASLELNSHWSLKLKAANLLNPSHRLTRRIDGMDAPLVLNEYKKGMDFSLGVSFSL